MSTVAEVTEVLPKLTTQELQLVEQSLHQLYRERNAGIIYDDNYGVWTEDDQVAVAAQVWAMLDADEAKRQ